MKKILITGGAGFIGGSFVNKAKEKYEICVVDNLTYASSKERVEKEKINFYQCDISDIENLEKVFLEFKPEIIVHFAAETHVDRSIKNSDIFIKSNVLGTHNLLSLIKKHGIEKFINVSTDEVYGDTIQESFAEESRLRPNSPYAASKASADLLARSFYKTFNLPIVTIRPSNNYGPWQFPEKLIPVILKNIFNNKEIPIYGNGENIREWIFVEDTVEAILEIIKKSNGGEVYNIGSGQRKTNLEIVDTICELMGLNNHPINFIDDRKGHDKGYFLNSDKINFSIGWKAKTELKEGLKTTIEWYKNNKDFLSQ